MEQSKEVENERRKVEEMKGKEREREGRKEEVSHIVKGVTQSVT